MPHYQNQYAGFGKAIKTPWQTYQKPPIITRGFSPDIAVYPTVKTLFREET